MCPSINNPSNCETGAVTCFLHGKDMDVIKIHHELCMVYGKNVMNECMNCKTMVQNIRRWMGEQMSMLKGEMLAGYL
jgi:hypothetical protein